MELEDYVEKLQKQKKLEKKERKAKEKNEKIEVRTQQKNLMRYTSSQKVRLSKVGARHKYQVFKERRKNYYNYPRGVVYLSSIPHGFFEEQMASYFSQFGKVTGIYMPRAASGKIKGYAFIEFQLEVIAKIVAETMNNYLFYQRILKARYIPPAEQKPCMFVWPFADKNKKVVHIEAELKKRQKPISEEQVNTYKRRLMNRIQKKIAGVEYSIQSSGEAPPPLPPPQPIQKKLTKEKLREIAIEAKKSTATAENDEKDNPLDDKLALKIKRNIAAKLARPLKKKTKKNKPESEEEASDSDDDFHSADDFETADENSFFGDDANEKFHDTVNMDFNYNSYDEDESPVKKAKLTKSVTPKGSVTPQVKSENNTPAAAAAKKNQSPQSQKKKLKAQSKTPNSVQTDLSHSAKKAEKTPKGSNVQKTPKSGKRAFDIDNVTPADLADLLKTPKTKSVKKVGTPNLKTPDNKPSKLAKEQISGKKSKLSVAASDVQPALAKAKKSALVSPKSVGKLKVSTSFDKRKSIGKSSIATPKSAKKGAQKLLASPKSVVKVATSFDTRKSIGKSSIATPKSAKKGTQKLLASPKSVVKVAKEKSELKRKSMSDVKAKRMNVEKKRKSLPK